MRISNRLALKKLFLLLLFLCTTTLAQPSIAAPSRTVALSITSPSPNTKIYPYSQILGLSANVSSGSLTGRTFSIDSSSTATGCALSSNSSISPTLTAFSSGTCVIRVTVPPDSVTNTATFTFLRANQSVSFGELPNSASYLDAITLQDYLGFNGDGDITLSTGSSTACNLSSPELTTSILNIIKGTGTCRLTASIAQDVKYNAASAYIDITVSRIEQNPLSNPILSATSKRFPYSQTPLSISSGSGGSGSGSLVVTGVANGTAAGCSWNNLTNTLSATSAGTCIVNVRKGQDDGYNAAEAVATFTFLAGPAITSFTPLTFKSGDLVTINGGNFTDVTKVRFGTSEVNITPTSATQIKVLAPSSPSSGILSVVTSTGESTSSIVQFAITTSNISVNKENCPTPSASPSGGNSIQINGCQTFQNPSPPSNTPTISGVTKVSSTGADTFTITGTNLRNPSSVSIGSTRATVLSASNAQILARIRTNINGSFTVTVVVSGRTATFNGP